MVDVEVILPVGLEVNGAWCRSARLRPLSGHDEAFAVQVARLPPAARISAVLERVVVPGEGVVSPEHVRALVVGDREALLLHLRRMFAGERLALVIVCPAPECGERMDWDVTIEQILGSFSEGISRATWHEIDAVAEDQGYRVRFRLPTGLDMESVANTAKHDAQAAMVALLHRCVAWVRAANGEEVPGPFWPQEVVDAVSSAVAELDPYTELRLDLECPSCGRRFPAAFEIGNAVCGELSARGREVFREIHRLALYYHWSEAELLAMAPDRRRIYLDLLDETFLGGTLS